MSFLLSTVVPALILTAFWFIQSRHERWKHFVAFLIVGGLIFSIYILNGLPRGQWPLDMLGHVVAFAVGFAALEVVCPKSKGLARILWVALVTSVFIYSLRERMLDSELWAHPAVDLALVTGLITFALCIPGVLASNFKDTLAYRIGLVVTGVAMSVIILASGSALVAQVVGVVVALMSAMIVGHILFFRGKSLAGYGLMTVNSILGLLTILTYFFVEVPRWSWLGVCVSLLLLPLASRSGRNTLARALVWGVVFSMPALIGAAYDIATTLLHPEAAAVDDAEL